jgi:hypothetical protein
MAHFRTRYGRGFPHGAASGPRLLRLLRVLSVSFMPQSPLPVRFGPTREAASRAGFRVVCRADHSARHPMCSRVSTYAYALTRSCTASVPAFPSCVRVYTSRGPASFPGFRASSRFAARFMQDHHHPYPLPTRTRSKNDKGKRPGQACARTVPPGPLCHPLKPDRTACRFHPDCLPDAPIPDASCWTASPALRAALLPRRSNSQLHTSHFRLLYTKGV